MRLVPKMVAPLLCLFLAQHLPADDWAPAKVTEVFSKNRDYFVRIIPGESIGETWGFKGAKIGKHARAAVFHIQPDRGYRLDREFELLNPVAPVEFLVSNRGDILTLDNWHNVGYGSVLALYRPDGKLVRGYKLADLFPKREVDSFPQSISSIWWHRGSASYIDEDQKIFYMGYKEGPDYHELILKLIDGSVRLCANSPKYHCRNVQ